MIPGFNILNDKNLLYSSDPKKLYHAERSDLLYYGDVSSGLRLPNLTKANNERLFELNKIYNKKLVELGKAKTRSQIKDLDRIDVRGMLDIGIDDLKSSDFPSDAIEEVQAILKTQGIDEWREQVGIYSTIPCYSEGVLQVAAHRYVYWKVVSIEIEEPDDINVKIFLKDYRAFGSIFQPGTEGIAEFVGLWYADHHEVKTLSDILFDIPEEQLNWSKEDIAIWKKLYAFNSSLDNKIAEFGTSAFEEMVKAFTKLITMVNFKLSQEKPVADRKANKKIVSVEYVEGKQPKRLIRNISGISFQSEKPPKSSTKETVIKYKVASWKARGGFRHLKDGRIIPFKESIRHRKALLPNDNVPVSVLKVN